MTVDRINMLSAMDLRGWTTPARKDPKGRRERRAQPARKDPKGRKDRKELPALKDRKVHRELPDNVLGVPKRTLREHHASSQQHSFIVQAARYLLLATQRWYANLMAVGVVLEEASFV